MSNRIAASFLPPTANTLRANRVCAGTVLLNISGFWQRVIVGGVVLVAVLVDLFRHRQS